VTHIDRVRALLAELQQTLDDLEQETAAPKKHRKAKPRGNVQAAILETRRRVRKVGT
jgi:ElaB/YqjD/DUF883 family membrane-anchored ribosome-binding protein